MKKIFAILFMFIAFGVCTKAGAQDIGTLDYKKVEQNYNYAKTTYKQIEDKVLELQKFLLQKEGEYKNIDSPIKRKNFEEQTQKLYKAKEDAVLKFKVQKEEEIYNNIMDATKAVAKQKKIDIVANYQVFFIGGIDISDEVIKYLNSNSNSNKK